MSICQISIPCTDIEASEELYVAMLKPLRYKISIKTRDTVFFSGRFQFRPELCLRQEQSGGLTGGVRITIYASSKARVNKFYILGLSKSNTIQRGTTDDYPNAYRASITDPDGNIIEAIYLKSWWSQIIHFPIPITGQMVIGVIYLQILLLIGFSISVAIGLILEQVGRFRAAGYPKKGPGFELKDTL
ncbi:hypothetical protein EYC84_010623 [Monilinia fructicola]|uniref:VOC domain-containing protein n=1 Tax=Monilinia fructicola TaxID=38448 RepID=A0A5M9JAF6_MONFR|nr:hypothetical protein EYC84_010623 [Monilinia fructicola]